MRSWSCALTLVLLLSTAGCRVVPRGEQAALQPTAPSQVPRHGRFELTFDVPDRKVAPDDVSVHARFRAPSGRETVVGGFASRGRFKVRFAPGEVGRYRYTVEADGGGGFHPVAEGAFEAVAGPDPGYLRPDPAHPHRLAFEDGRPFFILGENRINIYDPTWNVGQLGIRDYVRMMAANGMTTLRVFIISDVEAEERPGVGVPPGVLEPAVGRFDERTAEDFDRIFEAAEENNVYVVLTVFALGFSPDDPWKSWVDNPYSAERGGPAKDRFAFLLDPLVIRKEEGRLRYLAARYGYSTHLLAIDLLNEPEWDGAIPEVDWVPWAERMAMAWRALDPYHHPVTVGSVGLQWNIQGDERPWYASPQDDLIQWHLYGKEFYEVHALAAEMTRKVRETWGYGKPIFVGEFAYGGEPKPAYDHTHVGIWSTTFSGAGVLAHSAPQFNIDSDELMTPERAHHFAVLSAFLRLIERYPLEPQPDAPATPAGLRVWSLGGEGFRALWLLAPQEGYDAELRGARVTLEGLRPGHYRLEWWDDVTGEERASRELDAGAGALTVEAPPFVHHLAATLAPASH